MDSGNRRNINVWLDPWLSTKEPLCPIGPPTNDNKELKVADLIDSVSKEWKLDAIRLHLLQYEDLITRRVLSEFGMKDEMVWLQERT